MEDSFQRLGDVAEGIVDAARIMRPARLVLRPSSREEWLAGRAATVGASELPALFGVHAHLTPFELFAVKSGLYRREFAEAEVRESSIHLPPTERGNALEPVAFELLRRLRPTWTVLPNQIPGGQVFVDTAARMSSTPDAFIVDPAREGRGSFQCKSMASSIFDRDWKPNGVPEAPVAVAVQAIADATLSGCEWACCGAIVAGYGIDFYLFDIPVHGALMVKARELVADFWERIEDERPYPADFARDGAAIAAIYGEDDGTEINLSGSNRIAEVIARREELKAIETAGSVAEKERRVLDAEIIAAMGNSSRARLADGRAIEAPTIRRKGHEVKASSFRTIRIKQGEAR